MARHTLIAQSPLAEFSCEYRDVSLAELTKLSVLAIATPLDGEAALASHLLASCSTVMPTVGKSATSDDEALTLLRLQSDQMFVLLDESKASSTNTVSNLVEKLGAAGYVTDQSDSWVILRIDGVRSRAVLERICPINLNLDYFKIADIARTQMQHLSVIMRRDSDDSFVLMSPRSSATSFLRALTISIENTSD